MTKICIKGLDKALVFKALYDNAKAQGLGFFQTTSSGLSIQEAQEAIKNQTYFDYYRGRVMKIDLSEDTIDTWLYDRDNGEGTAERALNSLLAK